MKPGPLAWETKWKTAPFSKMSPNTGWEADVKGAADNIRFSYIKLEAPKGYVNVALLQGNRTCVWNSDGPGWR